MPTYNNVAYRKMPQQVQKNREDIVTFSTEFDAAIANNEAGIQANEDGLEAVGQEVDFLAQAISEGGVIVNRKIGAIADVPATVISTKVEWPEIINESAEQSVITFDANNDHILITKGQYSIAAQLSLFNTTATIRTVTLNLYATDIVTTTKTLIDTTGLISITNNETVNVFPQYTYDKISDNNILITVEMIGETQVTLKEVSNLHVNTVFTVAGTGIPSTSRNIAPYSAVNEGIDEDELTLSELLTNLKSLLIEKDIATGDTILKLNGTDFMRFVGSTSSVDMQGGNRRLRNIADPTNPQDTVTKAFMENVIAGTTGNTLIKRAGVLYCELETTGFNFQDKQLKNVADPTASQDVTNKQYVDGKNVRTELVSQVSPVTTTAYTLSEDSALFMNVIVEINISGPRFVVPWAASGSSERVIINGTDYVDYTISGTTITINTVVGSAVSNVRVIGIGKL